MPSFDVVSEADMVEVRNAIDQTNKEVSTSVEINGTDARVELSDKTLTIKSDDEFKLKQVTDILTAKFSKRGVDTPCHKPAHPENESGNKVKQEMKIRDGIDSDLAKRLVKLIKDSGLKVQASIQGDTVRVNGAKRDVLQDAIAHVKKSVTDFPLKFGNFRD